MIKERKRLLLFLFFFLLNLIFIGYGLAQPPGLTPEYFVLIQQKINTCFVYPQEAKTNGWEGIAKIKFTLVEDGRIKEMDVAESSGYPLLDAAAMLAIKDASPYPFPEDYPPEDELEILLPVTYTLPLPESRPPLLALKESPTPLLLQASLGLPKETKEPSGKVPPPPEAENLGINQEIQQGSLAQLQELESFVDLALKNNQPTKVAQEEVELAQLKVLEAKRNLFPALKIQSYRTEGEVYKIDYEEKETKIQVDQPVWYAGRLADTAEQARVNLEITQKNYGRLKLDVVQKAEVAYYNLIAARIHLAQQEALRQEAKEILEKIEKLSAAGMVIPLEIESARSWLKQIDFKIDSIKQDLFMAELTFNQVLNVKETPKIEIQLLEAKRLDLDLPACLEAALQNRPETYLSELLMKFNNYGQKIEAKKERALTVDLTGSYGWYEGHYKTEPVKKSNNWYIGFKGVMPLEANTLNTSFSSDKTQPRFGQTSATASTTLSAELNLVDNLKRLSDKKRSDIDLHRAVSDFDETFKTIRFEVQDAFLNYQKAILQLNTAEAEMKFRRNETEVTKIRAMTGEASLSGAMESLYSLSEAQTKYIQALSNYRISLANLKKATGYGIKI